MSEPKVRDAQTFAVDLPDKMLHCRELGHVWAALTASWDKSSRTFDRSLKCRNCPTIRRQVLTERGHVVANSYRYPPGYLATEVQDRSQLSRDVFRLEAMNRWFAKHEGQVA